MNWEDIKTDITHQELIPTLNEKFKQILGYDANGNPPTQTLTIEELREQILTILQNNLAYDQAGYYIGKPDAGKKLFSIPATRNFTLPANCQGSVAKVAVAPRGTAVFIIKKNGYQIGTFSFPAGVKTATFESDETNFVAGDVLEIYAPAIQDADLEDPCWNLKIQLQITT